LGRKADSRLRHRLGWLDTQNGHPEGHKKLNAELERIRQGKHQLEAELARLVNAIAEGQPSQSFTAIAERQRELQTITNKLLEPVPGSLRATLDELRNFAISRLAKIRELISHPESVDFARAVLQNTSGRSHSNPRYRMANQNILLMAK